MVEIVSDVPLMREDNVKVGMGTADLRYRGEFRNWYADMTISYNANGQHTLEQIINIINAGIRGTAASFGVERLHRDVISKSPDLCVVCFGLNDVSGLEKGLQLYIDSLSAIFEKLKAFGCEVIFMTPNMINTYVNPNVLERYIEFSGKSMKWQNDGMMDKYMETAIAVAKKYDVPVCDVYSKWKKLHDHGVDTDLLLAEGVNHPIREMHELFASSLLDTMME